MKKRRMIVLWVGVLALGTLSLGDIPVETLYRGATGPDQSHHEIFHSLDEVEASWVKAAMGAEFKRIADQTNFKVESIVVVAFGHRVRASSRFEIHHISMVEGQPRVVARLGMVGERCGNPEQDSRPFVVAKIPKGYFRNAEAPFWFSANFDAGRVPLMSGAATILALGSWVRLE